jgi:transglutaminase-like putative cysteine protease
LVAGLLLSADRVPMWVPIASGLLIGCRVFWLKRPPRPLLRNAIALLFLGAIAAWYHTLNGLAAGTALLMLMGASKFLETERRRDEYVVIGCALFLLLAACLDRQELVRAPLYLAQAWLCCAALAVASYAGRRPPRKAKPGSPKESELWVTPAEGLVRQGRSRFTDRAAMSVAGRALLFALPLAVCLFLFFPRISGAFWALPHNEDATTGLGDTMSPGSITELSTSYDVAFRARFQASPPPVQELYWRGPVMHEFDGLTWRRVPGTFYKQKPRQYTGTPYAYRISLEPSSQRWWFSLDTPKNRPDGKVIFTGDYELIGTDPVTEITSYDAVSYTQTRSGGELTAFERRRDTSPAGNTNPRSKEFARNLLDTVNEALAKSRATGRDSGIKADQLFLNALLDHFRTGGFEYTLTPPRLGPNSVDDFLFTTHQGFCGHFASALVTLLRAGGVPAHVVTGYLGGEWNPVGGYFVVRQSDAHAWVEVWLEDRGWTRVDPTAVVEPGRLQRSIFDLLPNTGSAPTRLLRSSAWLRALTQRWDAMNSWWNDRVVKFDFKAQMGLLERLGIDSPDLAHLAWGFAIALIGGSLWIGWQVGRGSPAARPDRLARAYTQLCNKLARSGVPREPYQGPLAYADAVSEKRPDLAPRVRALAVDYARLRFGPTDPDSARRVTDFARSVSQLKIRPTPA